MHPIEDDQEDPVGRARALLLRPTGTPTPLYHRYLELQAEHARRVRERDDARATARRDPYALQEWPRAGRAYQERVDAAADRWELLGARSQVEAALAVLRPVAPR